MRRNPYFNPTLAYRSRQPARAAAGQHEAVERIVQQLMRPSQLKLANGLARGRRSIRRRSCDLKDR